MELCPVVDSAPGQHLREERGSREVHVVGVPDLQGPRPMALRSYTHQRDPGPGPRCGAMEGRARGGCWPAGQQLLEAGERRKGRSRRQPGSHQSPNSRHGHGGDCGVAGSQGRGAGHRTTQLHLRSRPFGAARAPVGGAAPAHSPGGAATQPATSPRLAVLLQSAPLAGLPGRCPRETSLVSLVPPRTLSSVRPRASNSGVFGTAQRPGHQREVASVLSATHKSHL